MREGESAEWLPFETDEDGYPTEEWLEHFASRRYCPGEAARFLINDLPGIADQIACMRVDISEMVADSVRAPGKQVVYATGGWSGAEDLIEVMLGHFWIRHLHSKWERGGAYWFEVPHGHLAMPARPEAAIALRRRP